MRINEFKAQIDGLLTLRTAQLTAANDELRKQIQERIRAEEALRDSEIQFRALIEHASDLIFLLDHQGLVKYGSPSIQKTLGYHPSDLTHKPIIEWIHGQDQQIATRLLTKPSDRFHPPRPVNLRWQHSHGHWIVFESTAQHFSYPTGFSGIVVNARDISDRLQIEAIEQSLKREKEMSELKLQFFSMASHEFRTPLSVILMAARILQNTIDGADLKQARNIERIQASARHLNQLLSNTLDIARFEANNLELSPKKISLKQTCDFILATLNDEPSSVPIIDYSYVGSELEVNLDPRLINSILTNLLTNAIKYSSNDDSIKFQVSLSPDYVEFQVSDQGIGIPLVDQKNLFKPFHRGNNVGRIKGSGLGLAIVKKCVELHDGHLRFQSIENMGTTFWVKIPILSHVEERDS